MPKPPASLDGLPLWTYDQLESLDRKNRKWRALEIHEAAGPELSPQFFGSLSAELLTLRIIDLQIAMCAGAGVGEFTAVDFGVPTLYGKPGVGKEPYKQWDAYGSTHEELFTYDKSYTQAADDSKTSSQFV